MLRRRRRRQPAFPAPAVRWIPDALLTSDNLNTQIWNLNGTGWLDSPTPPIEHQCAPQTFGFINYVTYIERCSCGAINMDRNRPHWMERNSSRRSEVA
jgi:hypothetical protein